MNANASQKEKTRIAIVSSYHPEYLWSQQTKKGVLKAFIDFGYLKQIGQASQFNLDDQIETHRVVIKKWWMDSKRKNSRKEIAISLAKIITEIDIFNPDIILLGDDNAANYVGNHYLDTKTPIVFWGINGLPLKYDLMDSMERPGHNITGVYQVSYHVESVRYLKKLFPAVKTMAVLSDDSPSGRSHAKKIQRYAEQGKLGVKLEKVVITNSYNDWKHQALTLKDKVDAFFILTHNTLKDHEHQHVNYLEVANWYLTHIDIPEVTPTRFYVNEGFLSAIDDSAFNQGYEAVKIAHSILSGQTSPAEIASYAPPRGPFIINRWRAKKLGIVDVLDKHSSLIDQYINNSAALIWKESAER